MSVDLTTLVRVAGAAHFGILIASALVPFRLDWKAAFAPLPALHRQMYWVYGGYVVLSIVAFGLVSLTCAEELTGGTRLARAVCGYIAVFWGVRLGLQAVFDAKPYLTTWWLKAGYHALTVLFLGFTLVYGAATAYKSG